MLASLTVHFALSPTWNFTMSSTPLLCYKSKQLSSPPNHFCPWLLNRVKKILFFAERAPFCLHGALVWGIPVSCCGVALQSRQLDFSIAGAARFESRLRRSSEGGPFVREWYYLRYILIAVDSSGWHLRQHSEPGHHQKCLVFFR